MNMCELSVYAVDGDSKELLMDGVVRLLVRDGKILMEGILGDSKEVEGVLAEVDIIAQQARVVRHG